MYYPRGFGGYNEATADGIIEASMIPAANFVAGGNWGDGSMNIYLVPGNPYAILVTFDSIPGADGFDVYATWNGFDAGDELGISNLGTRVGFWTDPLEAGTTVLYVLPYVYDLDGTTKLYGEMRTVIFKVNGASGWFGAAGVLVYYEEPADLAKATILIADIP